MNNTASPIRKSATGKFIELDNAADKPLRGLKLYGRTEQVKTTGKNLLPNRAVSKTENGVTFTVNADGSVRVNGTATAVTMLPVTNDIPIDLSGLNVVLSGGLSHAIRLISTDNTHAELSMADVGYGVTYDGYPNLNVYIYIEAGTVCNNVTVYPMIRISSNTDPAYEPYTGGAPSPSPNYPQPLVSPGDSGSIGVKASGKNLFDMDEVGTWATDGSASGNFRTKTYTLKPNTEYICATNVTEYSAIYFGESTSFIGNKTYTTDSEGTIDVIVDIDKIANYEVMICEKSLYATYEPYKDGGSLTASTPNGLPGIKVSSGGNYVDTQGQMWICDEIDLERGVYVQRIKKCVLNGSENWNLNDATTPTANNYTYYIPIMDNIGVNIAMCDRLPVVQVFELTYQDNCVAVTSAYGGVLYVRAKGYMAEDSLSAFKTMLAQYPLTLIHPLATPIETPLSAAELASYRAMSTFDPYTVVYSDSDVEMTVDYIGETDKFVHEVIDDRAAPPIVETASGSVVSITDGANRPVVDLISHIEPVQAGSGDPSPDNVRPISGWNSVTSQHTGKNICPGYKIGAYINNSGIYTDAYLTYRCTELIRVADGEKLIASHGGTAAEEQWHCFDAKMGWLGTINDINQCPAGTAYIAINYMGEDLQWVQVEIGNTATAYEPYQGKTLSATLPETVYGGKLDWTTGVLTVETVMKEYNGNNETWTPNNGTQDTLFYLSSTFIRGNLLCCSHAPIRANVPRDNIGVWSNPSDNNYTVHLNLGVLTDAEGFAALLAASPVQIVYKLDMPYTLQLTPQQLSTLKGINNVWSDCGSTELSYIADTKLYIDKKLAAIAATLIEQ